MTEQHIKFLDPKPTLSHRRLTVNLGLVPLAKAFRACESQGFEPQLAEIEHPGGSHELHLLLWEGPIEKEPSSIASRAEELAATLGNAAVSNVFNGSLTKVRV